MHLESPSIHTLPAPTGTPRRAAGVGEYLLRFVVIVLGIGVGIVLSMVIGLFTGWIPFC